MKKILMLKGLPASGKSTYAKELLAKEPTVYKRVNKDDLRKMLDSSVHSKENEKFVLNVRNLIVEEALKSNLTIIVDDTNLAPYHEEVLRLLAHRHSADFEVKVFDTPIEECIERDSKRPEKVGAGVITEMASSFSVVETYRPQEGLPEAVICDVDGTVAKMVTRTPFEWLRVAEDEPITKVIELVKMAAFGKDLIFLSGRDGVCNDLTYQWLKKYFPEREFWLYMRKENDSRKDFIIKKELFNNHVRGKYNVYCVFDDRDQVVKLWRDLGLQCYQVNNGNF